MTLGLWNPPPWFDGLGMFFLIALIVVGLFLIYPTLVLRKYIRIMINILDDVAPVPENGGGETLPLDGEEVSFRATDGHRLEGVILSARSVDPPVGMIVFAHEFGSDRRSCLRYCQPLLDAGYDVFAFDFRGHGGSPAEAGYRPRQLASDRERADMLGAIAFIDSYLEMLQRPRDIGVFGLSRGAAAAILASVGIDGVKAIVTDGAFSNDTTMEFMIRRFATIFARIRVVAERHPPVFWRFLRWLLFRACARKFGCRFPSIRRAIVRLGIKPLLLIHGEKDSIIPIGQSQDLYDLARGPKQLWIVPGAKHNQSVWTQPITYGRRLVRFFDEFVAHRSAVAPVQDPRPFRPQRLTPISIPSQVPALAGVSLDEN